MKKFMAIYLGSATPEQKAGFQSDPATMQAGMEAWGKWVEDHREAIVDFGSPLGKTKRADLSGISDTANHLTAYVIVQAETHEDAAAMFAGHPHFTHFPGKAIEIMEHLPMPGA